MKKRPFRIAAWCMAGTMLASMPVYASAAAGASDYANTILKNESAATAPVAGVSLAVSNYLGRTIAGQASASKDTASASADTAGSQKKSEKAKSSESKKNSENKNKKSSESYSSMAVAQVNDYVNIRNKPSENGQLVGKLYNESVASVIGKKNEWYKVESGSVTGYIKGDYITVGSKKLAESVGTQIATVNTTTLKVREKASKKSNVLTLVPDGEELAVASLKNYKNGWVKVEIDGGSGFVSADYVDLSRQYTYAESKAEEDARIAAEQARLAAEKAQVQAGQEASSGSSAGSAYSSSSSSAADTGTASSSSSGSGAASASGQAVVNYASQFVGNPYVYGGTSLTNGADCSGFVLSVYANFGVSLPHSSGAQSGVGYGVSYSDRQPGDIICYDGHVGIYVGNDTIVHASNPETGIKFTSPANYRTVVAVRRIFN